MAPISMSSDSVHDEISEQSDILQIVLDGFLRLIGRFAV
jgi:ABC-type molybdenum transport system ATPase subunit/photorepair protein PhrA